MLSDLDNRGPLHQCKVLVSGSAQGWGQSIALAFARAGAYVIACDHRPQDTTKFLLLETKAEYLCINADVTQTQDVAMICNLVEKSIGTLDVLVNCAGLLEAGTIKNTPMADVVRLMSLNVISTFRLTQSLLLHFKAGGSIINIAAPSGSMPGYCASAATDAAVLSLTKSWAAELGPDIRVNAICPDIGCNQCSSSQVNQTAGPLNLSELIFDNIPQAGDLEELAVFLASSQSRFINGLAFSAHSR